MPEIKGKEKLLSFVVGKRLGHHREWGRGMFAFSIFGEEEEYIETSGGEKIYTSGIFRRDNVTGTLKYYREPYYCPYNPRTVPQQTNRQKMTDAVAAWQLLTDLQKAVYNKRSIGKRMSGYNLFLKQYLLSH
ncbi:hypothetical protein LCGC14_2260250 [marine sediment metagenome]|uniref:Uncharacterized protein n=1 Tax=marine sediment metagenome TaxID=412755 RepID=A0A0F9D066_9ZZZZ